MGAKGRERLLVLFPDLGARSRASLVAGFAELPRNAMLMLLCRRFLRSECRHRQKRWIAIAARTAPAGCRTNVRLPDELIICLENTVVGSTLLAGCGNSGDVTAAREDTRGDRAGEPDATVAVLMPCGTARPLSLAIRWASVLALSICLWTL
mmetsp:Transcript_69128/g.136729  ORF Transcript_69128/g.136729 Transcript_69128/m.136729 type:complete len:152 (-) Transcript_69128:424-879(-)